MNRHERNYALAERVARTSECRYKFGAVITKGATVVSVAPNIIRTHPKFATYGDWCISIHAELRAILLARGSGDTIYVARSGSINTLSRPCPTCRVHIMEAEIRWVVYHDGNTLLLEDLRNSKLSVVGNSSYVSS